MKKDTYVYPAIFEPIEDAIIITFPDLEGCIPSASNIYEAFKNSKEAMSLHLFGMEEEGFEIPEPTPLNDIKLKENQTLVLIECYMPIFRDYYINSSVKKTLTIPLWLNTQAEYHKINFSKVLQDALKEKLNIKN